MAKTTDRRGGSLQYFVRFSVTALILVSGTLVLVLVVLPQRFVLSSGFREAGLNFPDPTVPFSPLDPVLVPGPSLPSPPPSPRPSQATERVGPIDIAPGPAELLWQRALPLLEAQRFAEALALFDAYLTAYPGDFDAARERLSTLIAAGRAEEAVPGLVALADESGDPDHRLWLARTLRDLGRPGEASSHYALLAAAAPQDEGLALEWSRALAWPEQYRKAAAVLEGALQRLPRSAALRAELARTYYYMGRLEEADAILRELTPDQLSEHEADALAVAVAEALAVPVDVSPPPSLLDQALTAREADDFARARALFEAAISESPDDADRWLAYANFLEYEMGDLEGALEALRHVDRVSGLGTELRFRLALLETWTGRPDAAMARLRSLLADLDEGAAAETAAVDRAEVRALMGDLHRWQGNRIRAQEAYAIALTVDPENVRARDGTVAVRAEVDRQIRSVEGPRLGSTAFGVVDTDDYGRFDVAGEWTGVSGDWAWQGAAGRRWVEGLVAPTSAGQLGGLFAEATLARWHRLGTVRTALRVGGEWIRDGEADLILGLGLEIRPLGGGRATIEYSHRPAYHLTSTLQSVTAAVRQDRLTGSLDRPLGDRVSLSVLSDVALLGSAAQGTSESVVRAQAAVTLTRSVSDRWGLGWTASGLTYSNPAPVSDGLRLYWDPKAAVATGPVVTARPFAAGSWSTHLRLAPGVAYIDDRADGPSTVPNLSGDAGLRFEGARVRSSLEVFFAQSRLEGYRTYGLRLSLSRQAGPGVGGAP